jgi:hypothetical protein
MEDTYTYTARSIEYPEQAVTFTLHDHHMSVEMAAPVEQVERMLPARDGEEEGEFEDESKVWLKPLAVSLLERGVGPSGLRMFIPWQTRTGYGSRPGTGPADWAWCP